MNTRLSTTVRARQHGNVCGTVHQRLHDPATPFVVVRVTRDELDGQSLVEK